MVVFLVTLMSMTLKINAEESEKNSPVEMVENKRALEFETDILRQTKYSVIRGEDYVSGVDFKRNTTHPNYHPSWEYYDWSFNIMTVDQKTVYCLDPETQIPSGLGYVATKDWGYLNHTQQELIIKTANYGYGYEGNYSAKMHWATQVRIWEIAGWDVTWGTLNADEEYKLIQTRIENHEQRPIWHGSTIDISSSAQLDLSDNNLRDFNNPESMPSGLSIAERNDTVLKINIDKAQFRNSELSMTKNAANPIGESIVYRKTGEQTFFSAYNEYPIETNVNLVLRFGKLVIEKRDTEQNTHANIVFELSKDKINILSTHTTDNQGRFVVDNLEMGHYFFREKQVVSPLILNTQWQEFEISSEAPEFITVVNQIARGRITGTKTSSNNTLIQGAIFEIRDLSGIVVDTVETNGKGVFESKDLPLGDYKLIEVSVPLGLVLNPEPILVTIKYQDHLTSVVINDIAVMNEYQRGTIEILKVEDDADPFFEEHHEKPLKGVHLALYAHHDIHEGDQLIYSNNTLIGSKFSDEHGKVRFDNLPLGAYAIKEIDTVEGYQLEQNLWYVEIKADQGYQGLKLIPVEKTVHNRAIYGTVELVKVNEIGTRRLEGAVFELRRSSDDSLIGTYTSDKNGRIVVDDLRYSTGNAYYFKELSPPKGYWIQEDPIYFDIESKIETKYTIAPNRLIQVHLMWHKVDESNQPISGVGFRIRDKKSGEFIRTSRSQGSKTIEETIWYSDEAGSVFIEGLIKVGEYTLEEVEHHPKYLPLDPVDFIVDEHQNYVNLGTYVGLALDLGGFTNTLLKGNLNILKKDADTGDALSGFGFNLLDEDGKLLGYYETDENGVIRIQSLPYGIYEIEEIKVSGNYAFDSKQKRQILKIDEDEKEYYLNFENQEVKGRIMINKIDSETENPITASEFGLFDVSELSVVTYEGLQALEPAATAVSDSEGIAVFESLDIEKKWAIIELKANQAYHLSREVIKVNFEYDGPYTEVIECLVKFKNEKRYGVVEVSKVDIKTKKPIEGVRFALIELPNGETPSYEALLNDKVQIVETSDHNGSLTFPKIELEKEWALIELESPYGYQKSEDIIRIHFDEKDQSHHKLENKRLKVLIKVGKRDAETKQLIQSEHLKLQLRDENQERIPINIIDESGIHYWLVDALETYYVKETQAPLGYILSDESLMIDTREQQVNNEYKVTLYNEAVITKLPKTGIEKSSYYLLGFLLVNIGLLIRMRTRNVLDL